MKKITFSILAILPLMMAVSCGNSSSKGGDLSTKERQEVTIFLTNLYENYVLYPAHNNFSEIADHFSDKILNRLKNEFEYDDGVGYAVWLFRTDTQDGPGPSKVNKITFEKDNWCTVYFTDMGFDDICRFKVEMRNGEVYVLDFEK